MTEETPPRAARSSVKLPCVLDNSAAGDLKHELLEVLGSNTCINVDASAVKRTSTLCLQVIAAAAKSAAQIDGVRLRLHSVPQFLLEMISVLGLAKTLGTEETFQ